jgi:hypothetical protein
MTRNELAIAADGYFSEHLDNEFWQGLPEKSRKAAVSMSADDVLAELSGLTLDKVAVGSYVFKAICEQAVFLARNYESMTEGKVVTSESLEGLSTGYTLISEKVGLSIRALSFIKRAKTLVNGGSMRIVRG